MRQRNLRLILVGIVLLVLAPAFFAYMLAIAHTSNDPVEMMRTVGQVSGVAGGVGVALLIVGLVGKKT